MSNSKQNSLIILLLQVFCGQTLWAQNHSEWAVTGLGLAQQQHNQISITAAELVWSGEPIVSDLTLNCAQDVLELYPVIDCAQGDVSWQAGTNAYTAKTAFLVDLKHRKYQAQIDHGSGLALTFDSQTPDIGVQVKTASLNRLSALLTGDPFPIEAVLNGGFAVNMETNSVRSEQPVQFQDFNYEHSDDVIFLGISGQIELSYDWRQKQGNLRLEAKTGEALINQVYLDFSEFPVQLEARFWVDAEARIQVKTEWQNQQSMQAQARLAMDWSDPAETPVQVSTVVLNVFDAHHFNQQVLDGVLGFYGFDQSQMSGGFRVQADLSQGLDDVVLGFDDFFVKNAEKKIDVQGLNGALNWTAKGDAETSQLVWSSALLAGLPVAEAGVEFTLNQDGMRLNKRHQFPVFDGQIILNELFFKALSLTEVHVDALKSAAYDMKLDAEITPMSLKLITAKLGWPEMAGTISGRIPGLVKKGRVIELLGALDVSVFDGSMRVENLSMERLFGVAPVIAGDVAFEGFDLAVVTETFGFGRITGKLSGTVNELRITNWKTDRLDANVYTVKHPKIKQTISQRAVDNISSLGGIKGSISRSFLRFFEDFKYKKIHLSCKLHNSVCEIGGLKNQGNQFVIVEGGGIPKINIVGYVRSINWETFISRLLNANYEG